MARYIDADKLYAEMEDLYEHHIEMRNFSADGAVADCLDILDKQPTADVVEVVRCKDCKRQEQCCEFIMISGKDKNIDFCSYGKRK